MMAALPAELTDPLVSLNAAMLALKNICGATPWNIAASVMTISAWGSARTHMAVPEFVLWVESGKSALSSKAGFETSITWPPGWNVKLEPTPGYTFSLLAPPRFSLTLSKSQPPANTLSTVEESQ